MNLSNIIKKNGGITLNTNKTAFEAYTGYMASLKGTEIIVSAEASDKELEKHFDELAAKAGKDHKVGYWADNDKIYIDISVWIKGLDEAMSLARANDQLAIFDLKNLETIRVK